MISLEPVPVCRSKCRNRCSPPSAVPHRAANKTDARCLGSSAKCFVLLIAPAKWSHWCFCSAHDECDSSSRKIIAPRLAVASSLERRLRQQHVYILSTSAVDSRVSARRQKSHLEKKKRLNGDNGARGCCRRDKQNGGRLFSQIALKINLPSIGFALMIRRSPTKKKKKPQGCTVGRMKTAAIILSILLWLPWQQENSNYIK